jgi:FkbM family methyltransferase
VNVLGYLTAEHGIGEAARQLYRAVRLAGIPAAAVAVENPAAHSRFPFEDDGWDAAVYDTTLLCTTPHQLAFELGRLDPGFLESRHTIAYLWWELPSLPEEWAPELGRVDEIWVANEYIAGSLRPATTTPVRIVPLPVSVTELGHVSKQAAGLPDRFVFLFSFDFITIFIRKNPLGLVEAYRRAFAEEDGAYLLLKSIDGEERPQHLAALREAIAGRCDIELRDGFVPTADKDVLMAACDCYVSLHRCEGLSLTLAEAMLYAKPAIATAYSGNLGFMNERNSYLVPYSLGRVPEGCPPFPVGAEWADPDLDEAARLMRFVFDNPAEAGATGLRGQLEVRRTLSPERIGDEIGRRLRTIRRQGRLQAFKASAQSSSLAPGRLARSLARTPAWPVRRLLDRRFAGLEGASARRHGELLDRLERTREESLRLNHERAAGDSELLWFLRAAHAANDELVRQLSTLAESLRTVEWKLAAVERAIDDRIPHPITALDAGQAALIRSCRATAHTVPGPDGTVICRALARYRLVVDPTDLPVASYLASEGVWEPWNTIAIARELEPGGVALDVGANCGYFTVLMADLVGQTGRVVAAEPNPRLAALAEQSLWINGYEDRAHVVQRAVTDSPGRAAVLVVPSRRAAQAALGPEDPAHENLTVETTSVDALAADLPGVDLVKIDAEGSEQAIWAGMSATLERNDDILVVMEVNRTRYADADGFYRDIEAGGFPLRTIELDGRIVPTTRKRLLSRSGELTLYLRRGKPGHRLAGAS